MGGFGVRLGGVLLALMMAVSAAACGVGSTGDGQAGSDDEAVRSDEPDESGADVGVSDGGDADSDNDEANGETDEVDEADAVENGAAVLALSDDPAEWVRQVLVPSVAFPADYQIEDSTDTSYDNDCFQQPATIVEHPPLAFAAAEIGGDNLLGQLVARYESEADAAAAFTYFESLEDLCHENWLTEDEFDFSTMYINPISPAAIEGVDRLTATGREVHGPDAVIAFDVYGAQVGDALLLAFATDAEAAKILMATLTQRAQGIDVAEPLPLDTPMEALPGFRSVDYWSWPGEGPALVRQTLETDVASEIMSAGSVDWLNNASDGRIDQLAGEACVVSHDLSEGDNVDLAILGVYTEEEVASTDALVLGEAFGFVAGVYCPPLAEKIGYVVGGG